MTILKQWIAEGFLTPATFQKLDLFLTLLEQWNARVNLTGLRSRPEMEEILIAESLSAARVFPMSGKSVLDVGSGAGIPGIVWAIFDPSVRLTSLEIREKKVTFQKEVQRTLALDIEIVKGLFPDAVEGRKFDVVAARAVRFTPVFATQAAALLVPGGYLVRFAGPSASEEGWDTRAISPRASMLIQQI